MTRAHHRSFVLGVGIATAALAAGVATAGNPPPSLDDAGLARGPFSVMHMMLQKTILKINIATVDVRVDQKTQGRLADLARGKAYSGALEQQLAVAAIAAERAVVQMQFKHDVPLKRWMGVVRDNLEQARTAGLISPEIEQRVSRGMPDWFAALRDRGYEKGDRLLYEITPDALRTAVVSAGGQVLVDSTERDRVMRGVVLASYFAPGSELREPLLKSLLEPGR